MYSEGHGPALRVRRDGCEGIGMRSSNTRITDVIRHHWDRRAATFDTETGHGLVSDEQRRAWLELLSRLVGEPPRRVLDVGCGTGFVALRLAELGHTVTGVDLSPRMIGQARRKAESEGLTADFHVADAASLDLPAATFDLVVARHVIWNLPDPVQAVGDWLRVLRQGGRLALVEGKWADNEAQRLANAGPASQVLARIVDAASALAVRRRAGLAGRVVLSRRYRRLERELPFSGGPTASRLATFLEANSVQDVVVEDLMDATLWGGAPEFPRYLVTGIRGPEAAPG
jgi:ubiquinone/menaquinone biosynthesis C-methylase UbiE